MALTDPQDLIVNGVSVTPIPRIIAQGTSSKYMKADNSYVIDVKHNDFTQSKVSRVKHAYTVTHNKTVTDTITGLGRLDFLGVTFSINRPLYGWTDTEVDYLVQAVKAELTTAVVKQLVGRES